MWILTFSVMIFCVLLWNTSSKNPAPFIQYDQFNQSLELFKFFHDIKNGYYVDIGAYDPVVFSNTLHLYQRGWNGINIEPSPERFEYFSDMRSDDVNLNIAVADKMEYVMFYDLVGGQPLATISPAMKKQYESNKLEMKELLVPAMTMQEICYRYYKKKPEYLNIDIEGFNVQALLMNDWNNTKCRPDIITSQINHHFNSSITESPRKILEQNGYQYFMTLKLTQIFIETSLFDHYKQKYQAGNSLLASMTVTKHQRILFLLHRHLKKSGYQLNDFSLRNSSKQIYHYTAREDSHTYIENINTQSNKYPNRQNRPILFLSSSPPTTPFLIRIESVMDQKTIHINQEYFKYWLIRKPDGSQFQVYIYGEDVNIVYNGSSQFNRVNYLLGVVVLFLGSWLWYLLWVDRKYRQIATMFTID